jgi:hypothetical protein
VDFNHEEAQNAQKEQKGLRRDRVHFRRLFGTELIICFVPFVAKELTNDDFIDNAIEVSRS